MMLQEVFIKKRNSKNLFGFTLIELMVVTGLILLFSVATLPMTFSYFQQKLAQEDARTLVSVIRQTQARAMKGREGSSWGVYLSPGEYTVFRGESWGERNPVYDQTFKSDFGVEYQGIDIRDGLEIVFKEGSGRAVITSFPSATTSTNNPIFFRMASVNFWLTILSSATRTLPDRSTGSASCFFSKGT